MSNLKLLETVADIAYIAGESKYYTGNSRADVNDIIYWAKEFEKNNSKTDWEMSDYMGMVYAFAEQKLKENASWNINVESKQ